MCGTFDLDKEGNDKPCLELVDSYWDGDNFLSELLNELCHDEMEEFSSTGVVGKQAAISSLLILASFIQYHKRHGERIARLRRRFAVSSFRNSSLAGSHFRDFCNL